MPEVRPHPQPELGSVNSLNEAVRKELWYLDTMVAMPFRMLRRGLGRSSGPAAQAAGETLWAMEGMTRLPVKLLQSAFGEPLSGAPSTKKEPPNPPPAS